MVTIIKIGITGGIASGKSLVLDELSKFQDGLTLDSDKIARETYEKGGPAYKYLVKIFGEKILDEEGGIIRKKLAEKIYNDSDLRKKVESIIHPLVVQEFQKVAKEAEEKNLKYVGLEVPLVFQSEHVDHKIFDYIVLVDVEEEEQLKRVKQRSNIPKELAQRIIDIQGFTKGIKKKADYAINSNGLPSDTRRRARELFERLLKVS